MLVWFFLVYELWFVCVWIFWCMLFFWVFHVYKFLNFNFCLSNFFGVCVVISMCLIFLCTSCGFQFFWCMCFNFFYGRCVCFIFFGAYFFFLGVILWKLWAPIFLSNFSFWCMCFIFWCNYGSYELQLCFDGICASFFLVSFLM